MIQLLPSGSFRHVRVGKMFNIIQTYEEGQSALKGQWNLSIYIQLSIRPSHLTEHLLCHDLEHDARGTAGNKMSIAAALVFLEMTKPQERLRSYHNLTNK